MGKQEVNQLIDSSLSLLAAIRTIMEDTPHILSIEAARAQMVAIKAAVSPFAQLPESTQRKSAAMAVTGHADAEENERPMVKMGREESSEGYASVKCLKRQIKKVLRNAKSPMSHKEILKVMLNRPSIYELDGGLSKVGLAVPLREMHRAGDIVKTGERNWCKYELPQAK